MSTDPVVSLTPREATEVLAAFAMFGGATRRVIEDDVLPDGGLGRLGVDRGPGAARGLHARVWPELTLLAGAHRFSSDAKLARAAGIAPIPVSSGNTSRHRLDRGGNRQINAAIHRIAVTRLRCHPETQDYVARKRAERKNTKDAIRCLKRHLTRRIWHLLQAPAPIPHQTLTPSTA